MSDTQQASSQADRKKSHSLANPETLRPANLSWSEIGQWSAAKGQLKEGQGLHTRQSLLHARTSSKIKHRNHGDIVEGL